MLIFRELQIALVEAQQRLVLIDSDAHVRQHEHWVDLLDRVNAYVKSLTWFPKCRYKREIRAFLMTGCSFEKSARKCGVSAKKLYTAVWQADLVLRHRLDAVIKALRSGNVYEAEQAFKVATEDCPNSLEFVLRHRHYEPIWHDDVEMSACGDELSFLQRLNRIDDDMVSLDRDRMEHLLYLLGYGNAVIRQYLYQCLEGRWSVADTLDMFAKHEASKNPSISVGEV